VPQPRWLDQRQQQVWQAYLHLNQHLYAFLGQELVRDSGLSGADYQVLHPLSEAPGDLLRARELGVEIGWDRSRLSHHLTRMERRGLVAREECVEDGRGLMVRLTSQGRKAIEHAAPQLVENVRRCFFDLVSEAELETLAAVFERLLGNLASIRATTLATCDDRPEQDHGDGVNDAGRSSHPPLPSRRRTLAGRRDRPEA
jgi:DNA-binding MarR family transcriptional regulator